MEERNCKWVLLTVSLMNLMVFLQALAKLQLPLADFRKLCILKANSVYPGSSVVAAVLLLADFQHQKGHESWWKGSCRVLTRESTLGIRRRRRKAMTRPTIITKTLHSFGMSHTLSCSPGFCVTILVSLILSYPVCVFEAFAQQVF